MYCPHCGFEYVDDSGFCSDCGAELVEEISEEKKYVYKGLLSKAAGSVISIAATGCRKSLNSTVFFKVSSASYRLFLIFVFLLNLFSLEYSSLRAVGPGWEIPVSIVGKLKFTGSCASLSLLLCILFFISGFKRYKQQELKVKVVSLLWFVGSIIFGLFSGALQNLPEDNIYMFAEYWWVGTLLPSGLLFFLIRRDRRVVR